MKRIIIWKFLVYLIIYSVIGFLLETLYAILMEGIIESRKSFIYGPFCIVYGIAAIILILSLRKYKSNKFKLFFYGMILGAIIEYLSSLIGEIFLHVKWWDYSNSFFNINGRTCLFFAIIWGILSIFLIDYFNPKLERALDQVLTKISFYKFRTIVTSIIVFMIFDAILSSIALQNFLSRISNNYNINIKGIDSKSVANLYLDEIFPDSKMIMTYPNIIVVNERGEDLYLKSILSNYKNYYFKLGNR